MTESEGAMLGRREQGQRPGAQGGVLGHLGQQHCDCVPGVGEAWGQEEAYAMLLAMSVRSLMRSVAVACAAMVATMPAHLLD